MKISRGLVVFLGVVLGLAGGGNLRADNTEMQISGYLVDSDGTACSGSQTITFNIYSDSTGGTSLWSETDTVTCEDGVYTATLGDDQLFGGLFTDNDTLYLGVTVSGDSEMTPRANLVSCPFAQRATVADSFSGTLSASSIASGTVGADHLAADAVTSAKVSDGTIATGDLADSAITSAKVSDGTIATGDLADSAVTSAKISDGTIGTGDLADSAVTTAKIYDGAISTDDLADVAVTSAKLAANSVTAGHITNGTITADDLTADALDFASLLDTVSLDANFTVSQGSYTWSQLSSGTAGPAMTITASGAVTSGWAGALLVQLSNTGSTMPAVGIVNAGGYPSLYITDDGTQTDSTPFVVDASGNVGIGTSAPSSGLHIAQNGVSLNRRRVSCTAGSGGSIAVSDFIVGVYNSSAAACTVTLPSALTAGEGKIFLVKDEMGNAATYNITIQAYGTDKVDTAAATTKTLNTASQATFLYSNGTETWYSF